MDMDDHTQLQPLEPESAKPAPTVKMPIDQAQQIVNYLAGRPYREVAHLVQYLLALDTE